MSAPRVLVRSARDADRRVSLPPADAHHLARVLRARPGDAVRVFDGAGREWNGTLASLTGSSAIVELLGRVDPPPEPPVRVTLALGLLKGDQMDHAVRDATMLGASVIAPMTTAHVSVPVRMWKSGAALERWERIAIASARQCGRAVVPEIRPVSAFEAVLEAARTGTKLICTEPSASAGPVRLDRLPAPEACVVLIGPEGGWSAEELSRAHSAGATAFDLGPRTLRAETAPAVALASLWTIWGWR